MDKSGWWCFYVGPKETARYSRMLLRYLSGCEIFKKIIVAILFLTSVYAIDILYKIVKSAKIRIADLSRCSYLSHSRPVNDMVDIPTYSITTLSDAYLISDELVIGISILTWI